jgi:transcriptional regulator with XRE-family HTH domain
MEVRKMEFANRIRGYITDQGYVLKRVAEKSGIPSKKFYRLINGKTDMTLEEYESICKNGLGVDPAYFFKDRFSKNEKSA